jgi:4-aminobutyrate aminotransferase-like enzyme
VTVMTDGRVYIDFLAEAGVLALGYNPPGLVAAVQRTSDIRAGDCGYRQ